MHKILARKEAGRFSEAKSLIETGNDRDGGLATMIELACEGRTLGIRAWARTFLSAALGVRFEEASDEAESKTGSLQG